MSVFIVEKRNQLNHRLNKILIYEPTTFITNIPLIIMTTIYGQKILGIYSETSHPFHFNFGWSFFSLGLAALAGALFHGFGPYFRSVIREWIWKIVLICLGLAFFFSLMAASAAIFSLNSYIIFRHLFVIGLVAFLFQTLRFHGFGQSLKFFAISQLLVIIAFLFLTIKSYDRGYLNILLSGCLTAIAGGLWLRGWSLHKKFNKNDFFHVIQLVSIWLTYRGASLINNTNLP
ncbi:MAG: DUF6962 family protein [Candidatus Neomarinimicrobiota bacterium]